MLSVMSDDNQVECDVRLANALNQGGCSKALSRPDLTHRGPVTVDVLNVLDALASAGVELVGDDHGDVTFAYTTLLGIHHDRDGAATGRPASSTGSEHHRLLASRRPPVWNSWPKCHAFP
jgi:hypothetical protein